MTWQVSFLLLLFVRLASAGERLVIIDPGHGGSADSGSQAQRSLSAANNATSPSGLKEKDLTLELSLAIRDQVEALAAEHAGQKLICQFTRTTDTNPDFIQRAKFCASAKPLPSAIISIHFNAGGGKALGTLAIIHGARQNPNFQADQTFASGLIKATSQAVASFVPGSKARQPITDAHLHGGAGSNFFHQLSTHKELEKVPKCFLEVEFINRPDVDKSLLQKRRETFPTIARAIAEHLYGLKD